MDTSRTVVLMVFHNNTQANIIKNVLEASGISCFLSNENGPYSAPLFNTEIGLIRLNVLEKDMMLAKVILSGHIEGVPDGNNP